MIIVQFDRRYLRWALLLLRSLELHETGRSVLCDVIGLDAAEVAELETAHPGAISRSRPAKLEPIRSSALSRYDIRHGAATEQDGHLLYELTPPTQVRTDHPASARRLPSPGRLPTRVGAG